MLDQGAMVTCKDFGPRLLGQCGIVKRIDRDDPGYVWVRWLGELSEKREKVADLEAI